MDIFERAIKAINNQQKRKIKEDVEKELQERKKRNVDDFNWLNEQKQYIKQNEKEALIDLLQNTTNVLRDLLNNKEYKAEIQVAESCVKCNDMLLDYLYNKEESERN
jgi:hypothetical protein